jgi:hypothetical protein
VGRDFPTVPVIEEHHSDGHSGEEKQQAEKNEDLE